MTTPANTLNYSNNNNNNNQTTPEQYSKYPFTSSPPSVNISTTSTSSGSSTPSSSYSPATAYRNSINPDGSPYTPYTPSSRSVSTYSSASSQSSHTDQNKHNNNFNNSQRGSFQLSSGIIDNSSMNNSSGTNSPISTSSNNTTLRKRNLNELDSSQSKAREQLSQLRLELKNARKRVTLFRAPLITLTHFIQIILEWFHKTTVYLFSHHTLLYSLISSSAITTLLIITPGAHQIYVASAKHTLWFIIWWITLGILSSVGLGTGLHTFVLYLGPYIATITLAVTECGTLDIPTEGPNAYRCPDATELINDASLLHHNIDFFSILMKVAPACILWGCGTAIGELPPYFVSRAATLSGQKLAELDELDDLETPQPHTTMDEIKLHIYHALQRFGFWAIVFFASIPNPLFDLAGLTCGHFLIPFWTFFGATFIGKAIVKVHIQACFVIIAFSKDRLTSIINAIERLLPFTKGFLKPFFEKQRQQFHQINNTQDELVSNDKSFIAIIWNWVLIIMLSFLQNPLLNPQFKKD